MHWNKNLIEFNKKLFNTLKSFFMFKTLWGEQDYFMILSKGSLAQYFKTKKTYKRACDFFIFKKLWGEQDYFMILSKGSLAQYFKTKKSSSELVIFSYLKHCGESRIRTCEVLTADLQSALVGRLSISPFTHFGCKYKNTF